MTTEVGSKFIEAYKAEVTKRLALSGVDTTQIDPERFHNYCMRTFKNEPVKLYNNVKQVEYDITVMKVVEMVRFSKRSPIITGYNTLFHNHHYAENVPGNFLEFLKDSRDIAKSNMHAHQNDEDKTVYESLDREQKLFKLFANSYYGAFGQKGFHFFNVLLGPSVTAQGRQLISSAILGFEGFLTDNIYFHEFCEFSTYLTNILTEDYDDELLLATDYEINDELVFARLKSRCRFNLTETETMYVEMLIENASEGQKQKLFFKNNLFKFLECEEIMTVFRDELQTEDYHNPGKPPEEMKDTLEYLSEMLRYFVGYPYPYNHKTQHADEMIRKTVLVCDTDSNFLYVFPFLKWFCDISGYIPDDLSKNRRVSIISIITFFITKFIDEVFARLNTNANVPQEHQHLINMKSEFHYRRVILTKNKKSYAGIILSKEGNVYDKPKFDVKGIQIKKISTPKPARIFYSSLLEEKMLKTTDIDILDIYQDYHAFSRSVMQTVLDGETRYLKPATLKVIASYKKPFTMQSVRSSMWWNALFPREFIGESTSFKILELDPSLIPPIVFERKVLIEDTPGSKGYEIEYDDNPAFFEFLLEEFGQDVHDRITKLLTAQPQLKKYGMTHIAIPLNAERIPEQFARFAYVSQITSSVISKGNILLEALGFVVVKSRNTQVVSNVIRI